MLVKVKENEILKYYMQFVKQDFPANETQSQSSINCYIKKQVALMYLYIIKDEITGWAFLTKDTKRNLVYLQYLAVLGNNKSKGFGSAILKELKSHLKNFNYIYLDAEAVEQNNPIQQKRHNFYLKNGFELINLKTSGWGVNYNYFCAPLITAKFNSDDVFDSLIDTFLIKDNPTYLNKHFKRK